jgi:hypothetical protein
MAVGVLGGWVTPLGDSPVGPVVHPYVPLDQRMQGGGGLRRDTSGEVSTHKGSSAIPSPVAKPPEDPDPCSGASPLVRTSLVGGGGGQTPCKKGLH